MNLELKDIAPYLAYGLNIFIECDSEFNTNGFDPEFDENPILISGVRKMTGINYENSFLPDCVMFKEIPKTNMSRDGYVNLEDIKPLLRPLTDLTKEITHNGEKFVPLIELAQIAYQKFPTEHKKYELINDEYVDLGIDYSFHIDKEHGIDFDCRRGYNGKRWNENCFVPRQFQLFEKLFEWHFDVFGLVDKGLAIPIKDEQ